MAIRTDVSVDWDVNPRIITIASPSTTINGQDLVDTLRSLEHHPAHMQFEKLVNTEGKFDRGGGEFSIIILQLWKAKIAFEARVGPTFDGCTINNCDIFATDGTSSIDPIQTTAYVQVNFAQATTGALVDAEFVEFVKKMVYHKATKSGNIVTIFEDDGVTQWKQFDQTDGGRVEVP